MEYDKKLSMDFIKRTKKIIEQYETLVIPEKEQYEVTLKINCLYGLLIMPKAAYYNGFNFDIETIDSSIFNIELDKKKVEKCNSRIFFHCLRNAIAHWLERGNNNLDFRYKDGEIYDIRINGSGEVYDIFHSVNLYINVKEGGLDLLLEELYKKLKQNFA